MVTDVGNYHSTIVTTPLFDINEQTNKKVCLQKSTNKSTVTEISAVEYFSQQCTPDLTSPPHASEAGRSSCSRAAMREQCKLKA